MLQRDYSFLSLAAALALMSSWSQLASAAGGDVAAGRAAFAKCASCHQVGPSARGGFGPQLNGVIGRRAGSTADFKYSSAMASANFIWTEERLRAFMKSPDDVVPGNKMRFWGIGSERQRDDILAYLRSTTR